MTWKPDSIPCRFTRERVAGPFNVFGRRYEMICPAFGKAENTGESLDRPFWPHVGH